MCLDGRLKPQTLFLAKKKAKSVLSRQSTTNLLPI